MIPSWTTLNRLRRGADVVTGFCLVAMYAAMASPLPQVPGPAYEFTVDWVMNNEDRWRELLEGLRGQPSIQALEIGSYEGRSAIWFLDEILTHESAGITCIDLFEVAEIEARFDRNIERSGRRSKVTKIKANSQNALRTLPAQSFDFVYIDGSHTARDVLVDAVLSWDLLKEGGLLIFDDYRFRLEWHPARRPKQAIDAFVEVFGPYLKVVERGYQLVVMKSESSVRVRGLPLERKLSWSDWLLLLAIGIGTGALLHLPTRGSRLLVFMAGGLGALIGGFLHSAQLDLFKQFQETELFNAWTATGVSLGAFIGALLLAAPVAWFWRRQSPSSNQG